MNLCNEPNCLVVEFIKKSLECQNLQKRGRDFNYPFPYSNFGGKASVENLGMFFWLETMERLSTIAIDIFIL